MDNQNNQILANSEQNVAVNNSKGHNLIKWRAIWGYFFVPIFVLLCFAVMLYKNGVYPFGETTMSSYDMLAQVAPFIEHFYDVISGKSSLFYTYAIAGGADVYGTLSYCCVSPFTFIFLLFGDGNVYYGTSIVLPLKVACVGLSALIYLKKRFNDLPSIIQVALALSYAFCGYLFVSNTYINWVDLLIYLPFVALGFKQIVDGGKKVTFIVALSLMIYTCFSISCFSLLIIFPIMICYCLFVVKRENRNKIITDLVIALCLTVAVCLPILIPSLLAFMSSGRKTGLFDNLLNKIIADPLYNKITYIFTDGLTFVFTVVYLMKNGVKRPIDRFLLISCAFIFAPILVDEVCNLLNFGSYMSYALRFGFLNAFLFLFVSSLYFQQIFSKQNAGEEFEFSKLNKREKTNNILASGGLIALLVIGVIGALILNKFVKDGSYVSSFSGRFAHSLGGLEVTAIICAIVAIIALYGVLLMEERKISGKIVLPILLITVCCQSAFYTEHLVIGNRYTPTRYDQIEVITDYAKELDGHGDSRVKMAGDYLTAVMPFTLETNAFSVFSSVIDSRNFIAPAFFNFGGNGSNTIKSYNGTVLGDCLFGNKYFIVSDSDIYKINNKKHLVKVDLSELKDENGKKLDYGEYNLYKNTYSLPSALTLYSIPKSHEKDSFADFDSLMYALKGDSGVKVSVIKAITITQLKNEADDNGVVDKDRVTFRVRNVLNGYGDYYFAFDFEDYDQIYYNSGAAYVEENQKPLPDNGVIKLGYGSSGSYSVCLTRKNGEPLTAEYIAEHVKTFAVLNEDIKKVRDRANEEQVEVNLSAGKIEVDVTAEAGRYLMLNYVALPGHTAFVNGKEVALEDNLLNFMVVKLDEGENRVEIIYKSPYVKYMLFGLILAMFIFAAYYLLFIKLKLLTKSLEKVVGIMAYSLAGLVTLFFFIMPICVFIVKGIIALVKLIF